MDTAKMTQTSPSEITLPEIDISSPEAAHKSLRIYYQWFPWDMSAEQHQQAEYVRCVISAMRFPNAHRSEAMKQSAKEAIDKLKALFADSGR